MVVVTHFRELHVWQRGVDLVESVYRLSNPFQKSELNGLTSQIRRAAVSIPSNVAEGHTRESTKEYLNFVSMAQGSLAELETQLEIAVRLRYTSSSEAASLLEQARALGKQLYALRNALTKRQ